MKKRITKLEKQASDNEMSVEEYLDLKQSIEDHESPIRYILVSDFFGSFERKTKLKMFLRIEDDVWASDLGSATIFKRKYYAEAIRRIYIQDGNFRKRIRSKREIVLAKITIKNSKRKILKYYIDE